MKNKVVVVTGAGKGLGRALVRAFYNDGAFVYGISRSLDDLRQISEELQTPHFVPVPADVSNVQHMRRAFDDIVDRHGRLDILFNNAAVYPRTSFVDESPEEFESAIRINVCGAATCSKLALAAMLKSGYGRIFNVGSWADIAPITASAAYSSSKGALHALTKAAAIDIADLGLDIEVHEWIPGHLNTRMSEFTGMDPAISAAWGLALAKGIRPDHRSRIFENDREWLPPKPLKQRLKDRILFWR